MTRPGVRAALAPLLLVWYAGCADATRIYAGSDTRPTSSPTGVDSGAQQAGAVAPPVILEPTPVGEPADAGIAEPEAGPPPREAGPPPLNCGSGSADCDGDAQNGCEVDLTSDRGHCGVCDLACASPDCVCENGVLVASCQSGRADCDGDPRNGCETDVMDDLRNCGGCGVSCPDDGLGVAAATCEQGTCDITCQLPALRGNCDGDLENGCETDLFHDVNNCGTCGMRCNGCVDSRCL